MKANYKFKNKNLNMKKISQNLLLLLLLNGIFWQCNNRTMPPDSSQPNIPTGLKLINDLISLVVAWNPVAEKDIYGYYVYYGKASQIFSDTLFVPAPRTSAVIKNLESDVCYYFTVAAVDNYDVRSEPSTEVAAFTYFLFENFSQQAGPLDSTTWHFNADAYSQVADSMVIPVEVPTNGAPTMKSFAQHLNVTPQNNFFVECQFKLGIPNVGGAGIIIRSQKAIAEKYYKGYYAYLFWDSNSWNLFLEECQLDRFPLKNIQPVKLDQIFPDEWIKLSVKYLQGNLTVEAIRLSDYTVIGKISVEENVGSRRPNQSDIYCGFFSTQFGKNIIHIDNFGVGRLMPENCPAGIAENTSIK